MAVYDPEIIGGLDLKEKSQKTKGFCGQERANYGGLQNVRPPIYRPSCYTMFYTYIDLIIFSF